MKPALLVSFALLAPIAFLAGCGENKDPAEAVKAAQAGDELAITDGKLVLPAVSGSPAAAYFTLSNGTKETVSLAAASVEGSVKAEMHQTTGTTMAPITNLNMGGGASVTFAPGGRHVMVFGPKKSLKAGETTKLTLLFAGGKTVSAPLAVESAGGGMEHEGAH